MKLREKLTVEEFISQAKEVHGDKYDYSALGFKSIDLNVNVFCPKHGQFSINAATHLYGLGCEECKRDNMRAAKKEFKAIRVNWVKTKDLKLTLSAYNEWKGKFSVSERWSYYEMFVDFLIGIGEPEMALKEWRILQDEEWEGWNRTYTYRDSAIKRLIDFEHILKRPVITGKDIFHIAPKGSQLTAFGKRNIDEVFNSIEIMLRESFEFGFFEQFYVDYNFNEPQILKPYEFEYYDKFFLPKHTKLWNYFKADRNETLEFTHLKSSKGSLSFKKSGECKLDFVYHPIHKGASRLLREAENNYRASIGAKKIGEAWISETELYYKIKKRLLSYEVIQHGRPKWLGRQHLDIWIPELMVAVEYQGAQHDKPVDFFGGEEAFKKGQKRDALKRQKCDKAGVKLIEVRPDYEIREVIKDIKDNGSA
jgi:hypothetical protein